MVRIKFKKMQCHLFLSLDSVLSRSEELVISLQVLDISMYDIIYKLVEMLSRPTKGGDALYKCTL